MPSRRPRRFAHTRCNPASGQKQAIAPPVLAAWFGAAAILGLAFGLIGDRRPFGDGVFAHPLLMLFIAAAAAMLILRVLIARPVPDVISERMLLFGCFVALAAFLLGNLASALLWPMR